MFANTRIINICLLSKWINKLESGSGDLSYQIPRRKHMRDAWFLLKYKCIA
jgi:hypothetical protein